MQKPHAPEGRSTGKTGDAALSLKSSLPLSTSGAAAGPAPPRPLPATASVAAPRVEGLLSQPNTAASSPFPTTARSHLTQAEADYFSKDALRHHSIDNMGSATKDLSQFAIAPHHAKEFINHARRGLYGSLPSAETLYEQPYANVEGKVSVSSAASKDEFGSISCWPPQRSAAVPSEYPAYPNQSLSALQKQIHPPYHHAPYNSRAHLPLQPQPILSQLRTTFAAHSDLSRGMKSRTVANTPAHTRPLFTPESPNTSKSYSYTPEGFEAPSPYPSPYLHPVQPHPPRVVTNARKEVDVFSGRKMINHYEILDELGRGVHGKVKLARDLNTGEQVAIKIVQRYSKRKRLGKLNYPEDKVKKEVAILKKAQHPHVVRMIEVIDDPQEAKVYIVLEFCELKEIAWRTLGSSEIVLLENRRTDRESRGLPEEDVQTQEDRALRAAMRKLERSRLQPRHTQRARSASHLWSLEYGGESEDESGATEDTPKERSADEQSTFARDEVEDLFNPLERISSIQSLCRSPTVIKTSRRPSTSPSNAAFTVEDTNLGSFDSLHQTTSNSQWQRWSMPMSPDQSEDARGRRKASIAESVNSQITQYVQDEIPEEFRYVPTMTIAECRAAFRDALIGLDYLHYHGIIHRDLKPANLLRTRDYRVKISDFGVSYLGKPIREGEDSADTSESESRDLEGDAELAKNVGTPAFYAPELCSLDLAADAPAVTGQIDVWALGATLYCLLFARTPFHADNEFALMRKIATDNVFIPRLRLKAVDLRSSMRSPSLSSPYSYHSDKRLPGEYQHESIDDELFDLLRKLFVKHPKERITIKEIKHHPWVLRDIPNPTAWLEETDPVRQEQGRKIEISSKEVEDAVIPINFVNRIKSITSRAGRAFGFSSSSSRMARRRGHSSANSSDAGSTPSSAQCLPDVTKESNGNLRVDESIFAALKQSRESREREGFDHPLSRSVAPSPDPGSIYEASEDTNYGSCASSISHSFDDNVCDRPSMPERHASDMSVTASIRTIRPTDQRRKSSIISTPGDFPGGPQTIFETSGPPHLGGLWSGSGRNRPKQSHNRGSFSADVLASNQSHIIESNEDSPYGGPSIALSNTSVAGHVDLPLSLRKTSLAGSIFESPSSSRKSSLVGSLGGSSPISQSRRGSQQPSESKHSAHQSLDSNDVEVMHHTFNDTDRGVPQALPNNYEPQEEQYEHAYEALSRRRLLEIEQMREQESASRNASRPSTAPGEAAACPPSPDDDTERYRRKNGLPSNLTQQDYVSEVLNPFLPGPALPSHIRATSSASSEDQPFSGLSQSTSYPSIPSVMSNVTSMPDIEYAEKHSSSEGTINMGNASFVLEDQRPDLEIEADNGDAVETDEDDNDSDADEGFLTMSRRKSHTQGLTRSGSASHAQFSRRKPSILREKRPSRSGSTNPMKQVGSSPASHTL